MTSSMSGLYVILQFLATASVIIWVETLDFDIEYVLIRSITLPCLICNQLFVVKLRRQYSCKSVISQC